MEIKKDGPAVKYKVGDALVRITRVHDGKITFNFLDMRKTDGMIGDSDPKSSSNKEYIW